MCDIDKSLQRVCCCCWEKFGVNNKTLRPVNNTLEELMQLFIFAGYSLEIEDYPSVVCSNCHRNLYLLKEGKTSRGAWGEKIRKVKKLLSVLVSGNFSIFDKI